MSGTLQSPITTLLREVSSGNREAMDRLMPLIYNELRRRAANKMRGFGSGHTMQPTALVHEIYFWLLDHGRAGWKDRAHFYAVASQRMWRILLMHARAKCALKRGGGSAPVALDESIEIRDGRWRWEQLLELHDLLNRLAAFNPRQARIVELLFFGGQTEQEAAEIVGVSVPTVKRDWATARAWLGKAMRSV